MGKIVLEDFNEGNGYYKVNLAYLSKEQVEEIEALVSKWKPTDEDIKSCIGMCLTDANEQRFKDYDTNLKDCLAWLEKQDTPNKEYWRGYREGKQEILDKYSELKKQDEQKPNFQQKDFAPNEKPKFNIGDWIASDLEDVNKDFRLCKIIGVGGGCYTIQSANGCKGYNFFETWESDYHLWSIEDAKDGDILMANAPFIFNGNLEGGIGCPGAHCGINTLGEFKIPEYTKHWTSHTTTPATKEQRDLLFQKMHEAGYEWDANKKELKKIEQKFKVGDWVTNSMETVQITGYDIDYGYQVDYKGNLRHRDTDIIEKYYHLWTIQDAKDGDVLVCNDNPFLFSKYEKDEYGFVCCSYCGISGNKEFVVNTNDKKYWCDIEFVNPATKEQRDLLFQKMHETGYEWDAEKKELRKIEQKPVEWNSDDEQYLLICKNALAKYQVSNKWDADIISRWLENRLKSRYPQTKQEWSEQDEKMLNNLIALLVNLSANTRTDSTSPNYSYPEEIDWLKSFKERVVK